MTTAVTSRVEKWLQVSVVMLTTLGTTLLGTSQGNLKLAILLLFAGITSVIFTDRLCWFRLPRILANVMIVLLAFFWLAVFFGSDASGLELFRAVISGRLYEVMQGGTDSFQRLIAIASLLAYVQVVMLFQEKTLRIYGHLAIFSLLQVVVASLLSTSFEFGLALIFYIIAAFFTLSLFHILRQAKQIQHSLERARIRAGRAWQRNLELTTSNPQLALLAGSLPVPAHEKTIDATTAGILGWGFTRQILGIGIGTILFSITFFFCMPRSGNSSWQQPGFSRYRQVGFRRDVQLSDVGKLLLSDEIALRVSFTDQETGRPYDLFGEPYLRGAVLSRYGYDDNQNSSWLAMEPPIGLEPEKLPPPQPLESRDLVRQEFLIEINDDPALMAVFPAYQLPQTDQHVSFDPASSQLFLSRSRLDPVVKQYRYVLATDAFRSGVQQEMQLQVFQNDLEEELFRDERAAMTFVPANLLDRRRPGIDDLASYVLQKANVPDENLVLKCRTLAQFLSNEPFRKTLEENAPPFQYTLDLNQIQPLRQPGRDQVEDFLLNHRIGNCEYFASALVLMLRTQGIPARMAIGFRGGELNQTGDYFTVRQFNAHAWVEALLPAEGLSPSLQQGVDKDKIRGVWLRLDPTPVFRPDKELPNRSISDRIVDSFDYLQLLWDNNVLRMNPQQQRSAVFERIGWDPEAGFKGIGSLPFVRWFHVDFSAGLRAGLLSWNFVAWLVLVPLLGWVIYKLASQFSHPGRSRQNRKRARQRQILHRAQCEFFLRFEKLLLEHGFQRQPSQTQQEFALAAGKELQQREAGFSADHLLTRMVETYYRVRFGDQPLDEAQLVLVNGQIEQLAKGLDVRG